MDLFQADSNFMVLDYKDAYKNSLNNFTKGCKWSPDGSCFATADDQQCIRIFNTPMNAARGDFNDEQWLMVGSKNDVKPAVEVIEGEAISDYTWYPHMKSTEPETCCLAVACRSMPVHLWDAWDGKMICSYLALNHLELLVTPTCVSFSTNGSQLVCGYRKDIRIFATDRPGKQSFVVEQGGFSGIRSCIAFNPILERLFVVGSYAGPIGLFCVDQKRNVGIFAGHEKGVTHLKFSDDGLRLYSGSRKESDILCWDIRKPGSVLGVYKRDASNNQKIFFDLSPNGSRYLVSGSTNGEVLVWDTRDCSETSCSPKVFKAHDDCTNGISLNTQYPLMLTSSGQRHSRNISSPNSSGEDSDVDSPPSECTVKLWSIGNT